MSLSSSVDDIAGADSDSDVDSDIPRHSTRGPWFTVTSVQGQTLSVLQNYLILLRVVDPLTSRQSAHLLIISIDLSMKKTKVYSSLSESPDAVFGEEYMSLSSSVDDIAGAIVHATLSIMTSR
jgi:hypothetical protein